MIYLIPLERDCRGDCGSEIGKLTSVMSDIWQINLHQVDKIKSNQRKTNILNGKLK
jgi:hypothetical protein